MEVGHQPHIRDRESDTLDGLAPLGTLGKMTEALDCPKDFLVQTLVMKRASVSELGGRRLLQFCFGDLPKAHLLRFFLSPLFAGANYSPSQRLQANSNHLGDGLLPL